MDTSVSKSEAKLHYPSLTECQKIEDLFHLLAQQLERGIVRLFLIRFFRRCLFPVWKTVLQEKFYCIPRVTRPGFRKQCIQLFKQFFFTEGADQLGEILFPVSQQCQYRGCHRGVPKARIKQILPAVLSAVFNTVLNIHILLLPSVFNICFSLLIIYDSASRIHFFIPAYHACSVSETVEKNRASARTPGSYIMVAVQYLL